VAGKKGAGLAKERTPLVVAGAETMSSALPQAVEYHRWFYELIEPYLGEHILDVGSGLGNHLQFFANRKLTCLDLSPECIEELRNEFGGDGRDFEVGDVCDEAIAERLSTEGIDTITCLNVLEHIKDDRQALRNFQRILKPRNGSFVVIVPAHEFLYGTMDEMAGHYRRLNKKQLGQLMKECGFEVTTSRYLNAVGALGWLINGRVFKPRSLSTKAVNTQLVLFSRLFVPVIKRVENLVHPPFGQSLLLVAKAV
jgi:SAM-dependent methyltransferase